MSTFPYSQLYKYTGAPRVVLQGIQEQHLPLPGVLVGKPEQPLPLPRVLGGEKPHLPISRILQAIDKSSNQPSAVAYFLSPFLPRGAMDWTLPFGFALVSLQIKLLL